MTTLEQLKEAAAGRAQREYWHTIADAWRVEVEPPPSPHGPRHTTSCTVCGAALSFRDGNGRAPGAGPAVTITCRQQRWENTRSAAGMEARGL